MKKDIHPKYNNKTTITCVCGQKFIIGSTQDEIKVELCSSCHPFYTGKQRIVDMENLVKKFKTKQELASKTTFSKKKDKRQKRESKVSNIKAGKKLTLKDMLKNMQ